MMASQIPEVKPMKNLFRPDSGLMIVMTQITDCIFLSLFFLLGCVPVVTVGASFAALYDATYRGFRRGEKNTWQRFLQVFRTNWKAGILPTLVFFAVAWALGWGMIQIWNAAVAAQMSWMLFAGVALVAVVLVGVLSVMFPMLSRFENPVGALLKNTMVLAIANAPRALALGMLNAFSFFLCVRFVFPLFFLPSLAALVGSLLIEPMFKPYMPEESAEEAAE